MEGHYRDFPNPIIFPASPGGIPVQLPNNNAKGNDTIRTPKFTGNLSVIYTIDLGSGSLSFAPSMSHNSGFFYDSDNRLAQDGYTLLNAAVTWQTSDKALGISVWGRNLSNELYLAQGVPSAYGDLIVHAAPRTYGVTVRSKF